jgi:multidrug efflux pump subunit AcrA (membrane-fusion protein)
LPLRLGLPVRRADLIIVPHSAAGEYVIKDPVSGAYYHLGPEESLLLRALNGRNTAAKIFRGFEKQFGQPLARQDLDDFIELADSMNLLIRDPLAARMGGATASPADAGASAKPHAQDYSEQSILFWRKRLFDPDRLFNWVEPRIRFVWTRSFVALTALAMLAALGISWVNRAELVSRFADALSWQTFFVAWLAIVVATTCHEFAHGLTCKHFGGQVHDVGFLAIFFLPAFYANVSDAWLFREKSKRLYVTLAGGYCDLCLWAIAVFVWRFTLQDTLVNYVAWVIMTICGVRSFFNFNPLLKLDGYYLMSDLTATPNLRQRAWEQFWAHVRWALWGAPRPPAEPKRAYLVAFGAGVWLYAMSFLLVLAVGVIYWFGDSLGPLGTLAACALAAWVIAKQFDGLSRGEVMNMLRKRPVRVAALLLVAAAVAAVMVLVPMEDKATGTFQVRSTTRLELRAPMAGFLQEVNGDEGDRVQAGAVVARMHIPDLDSRIAQKRAEIVESEAKLRLLRFGPRGAQTEAASETQIRKAEVEAARAGLAKLQEELKYLEVRAKKLLVHATVAGVITTARLREKVGQHFNDGDLICVIEEPAALEAQIDVPEQEAARVKPGQTVELKARALPFEKLAATVDRVAPGADAANVKEGKLQSTVPVYCKLAAPPAALRPGMTGFARVSCGERPMGRVLADKGLRYLRTEFWW